MSTRSSRGFFSKLFKGFTMKKRSRHSSSKKIQRKSKSGSRSKSRRSSKRGG